LCQYHAVFIDIKADTLKHLRPIGEGDQELEKKLVQEELI
jgi:hypothetical protein